MAQVKFDSAGISAQDAGSKGSKLASLSGVPATIIGTSQKGPAFVPVSVGSFIDFINKFDYPNISGSITGRQGRSTNYAPLAAMEWLQNAQSVTFIRVLGVGNGKQRLQGGSLDGDVTNAGFTVGEKQPNHSILSGSLDANPYANAGGVLGRTYFLGCFMSESAGSNVFSSAGLQGTGSVNGIGINTSVPIMRGILMAPSGVILRLSSSGGAHDSLAPASSLVASDATAKGTTLGSVQLFDGNGQQLQQFVMLLNGHKGSTNHPNVITASLDIQSSNYITRVLNTTASLMQQAGHYLAAYWDIHPATAILTGTGVVNSGAECIDNSSRKYSTERSAFLITSSLSRDTGNSTVPNYEAFRDRFSYASTPWFISQKFHGKPLNLFKLHALDAGADVSNKYKIIVHDITPPAGGTDYQYGTFSLTIRSIDDFDEVMPPLESHINLSLNPSSERYISKVIGDVHAYFDFDRPDDNQKLVVEGNYPINSRYFRVEVSKEVNDANSPPESLPIGFRGISHIITSGSSPLASLGGGDATALSNSNFLRNSVVPPIPFADNIITINNDVEYASSVHRWGVKMEHVVDLTNQNGFKYFNKSIDSFTKYFPNNSTKNINFAVSDNQGAADTTQLGIVDADRFCNNLFTLENVRITTGSTGYSTKQNWKLARYIRNGEINPNDIEKTRRVGVEDLKDITSRNFLSFQTIMQGGFDGVNIFEENEFNLTNAAIVADMYDPNRGKSSGSSTAAYLKALQVISDTSSADMQLLAIPGIRAPIITDEASSIVESRFDSMYVMDIEQVDGDGTPIEISKTLAYDGSLKPDVKKTIDLFVSRGLNSSFVAAYFPDVLMRVDVNQYGVDSVEVPPSVVTLGAFSLNDSTGQPWFAPAGINRGALRSTLSTSVKLKEPDLNLLYSNNINPLYAPANVGGQGSGVIIWGQKTLSQAMSSLDRINVRRLLLEVRRQIRDIAIRLLFEPNRNSVIENLSSQANNRLSRIQSLFGLRNFNVKIDMSSTTQSDIDNHTIRGKIYVQPTRTLEYMSLEFVVSNGLSSEI
jgi:hypothetical protein